MTRHQRIQWGVAVAADRRFSASVYRVAMFIVSAFDERAGVFAYGGATIGKRIGMATSTVKLALGHLVRAGLLAYARAPSTGRNATAYRLMFTNEPTDKPGRLNAEEPTDKGSRLEGRPSDRRTRANRPISPCQPTDQISYYPRDPIADPAPAPAPVGGACAAGSVRGALDVGDITEADYITALARMRCHRRRKGEDITPEWLGLGEEVGRRQVLAVARGLSARERWPSKVEEALGDGGSNVPSPDQCGPWTEAQADAALAGVPDIQPEIENHD
jgi:hypothetical protein